MIIFLSDYCSNKSWQWGSGCFLCIAWKKCFYFTKIVSCTDRSEVWEMQNGFTQTTENIFISMNWWVSEAGLVCKFPLRDNLPDLNSSSLELISLSAYGSPARTCESLQSSVCIWMGSNWPLTVINWQESQICGRLHAQKLTAYIQNPDRTS